MNDVHHHQQQPAAAAAAPPEAELLEATSADESMRLSVDELVRALHIKTAVEKDERLRSLSDFDYVQYALTVEGDMDAVCERVYTMQCFRDEYKIDDTIEQGMELCHQMTQQQPGLYLAVEYLPSTNNYISMFDYRAFFPSTIKSWEEHRAFLGGSFYVMQCKSSNFTAIRNGISCVTECDGADFDNFDPGFLMKMFHEMYGPYPKNIKETFLLNAPTILSLQYSLWKRFMTPEEQSKWIMGERAAGLDGNRLDTLYHVPSLEACTERVLQNIGKFLKRRYTNQEKFSLTGVAGAALAAAQATVAIAANDET